MCDIPDLEPGAAYVQASAGCYHTVLLRSDGHAVACGDNDDGQCDIPELEPNATYITNDIMRDLLVQLFVVWHASGYAAVVRSLLTGDALAEWTIPDEALPEPAIRRVRAEISQPGLRLRVVQSDGTLLSEHCTWAELL